MNQYVGDEAYQALALDVQRAGLAIRKPTARIPIRASSGSSWSCREPGR